jgi:hypothetical protein
MLVSIFFITIIGFSFSGCDTSKLAKTPIENFEGNWQLHGRNMFNGIKISIQKTDNEYTGKVIAVNDNNYVQMFVQVGDKWITEIKRTSNFEFRLKEKKIGSELFSLYGLDTTKKFEVQFIDENTIGLGVGKSDPILSSIIYKRIEK